MKLYKIIMALFLAAGLSSQAYAVISIDQEQADTSVLVNSFFDNENNPVFLAQSFQQASDTITGAGIFLHPSVGISDTVTIELWSALPASLGATLITSGSGVATSGEWFDVFWDAEAIAPDTTHFLVFSGNTTLAIAGQLGDSYSRGEGYFGASGGSIESISGDYAFRTHTSVAAVPVPTAVWLLATGLIGLIGMRKSSVSI